MSYSAWAFVRRDFYTQTSYRLNFVARIVRVLISTAIFYFVSQTLGVTVNSYLQRYDTDYFHFVLLGIAFYPFIRLSINSMSEAVRRYQQDGTLEMLFLSPTSIYAILPMSTLWDYCWALFESLFYLLVASLIFQAQLNWVGISSAILIVVLAIFANAGLGLINVSFMLVTKQTSPLIHILGLSTSLLAGLYFPIEVLPIWLRSFSYLLPATYSFDALRRTLLQETSLVEVWQTLLVLAGFSAVLLPLGLITLHYAVRWAKMDGSLAQY